MTRVTRYRELDLSAMDIVLNVGGIAIAANAASLDQIQNHLSALRAGDTLKVSVLRGGRIVRLAAAKPH